MGLTRVAITGSPYSLLVLFECFFSVIMSVMGVMESNVCTLSLNSRLEVELAPGDLQMQLELVPGDEFELQLVMRVLDDEVCSLKWLYALSSSHDINRLFAICIAEILF